MASGTFRWVCDERRTKVRLVRRTPWRRRSRSGSSSPPRSRRGRGARNPSRCCRRSRFGMTDKWPRTFDLEKGPRKDWGFCKGVVTRAYRKGWPRSRWTPLKKWRNCFNKVKDVFFFQYAICLRSYLRWYLRLFDTWPILYSNKCFKLLVLLKLLYSQFILHLNLIQQQNYESGQC